LSVVLEINQRKEPTARAIIRNMTLIIIIIFLFVASIFIFQFYLKVRYPILFGI